KTRLSALPKMSGLISVTLAGMAVLYGALAMFLPDSAGIWMLGDSWASGSSLILPLVLATAAGGLSYGATSALRAMQKAKLSLNLRLLTAPPVVAGIALGALWYGAVGALIAAAVGALFQAVVWWSAYLTVWHRQVRRDT
ncbi:hypothetical protein JF66_20675, partial [Cryobacterium sp. MLB-32]